MEAGASTPEGDQGPAFAYYAFAVSTSARGDAACVLGDGVRGALASRRLESPP